MQTLRSEQKAYRAAARTETGAAEGGWGVKHPRKIGKPTTGLHAGHEARREVEGVQRQHAHKPNGPGLERSVQGHECHLI